MKKLLLMLFLMLILTGCNFKPSESSENYQNSEVKAETTAAASTIISTTTTETVTEEQTEPTTEKKTLIDNSKHEYPKVAELKLEAPSETDLMNRRKIIFPTDDGYYYYVYIGGRDSANYTLGFDSGDGNVVPFMECEDCVWYFMKGDTIYGTQMKLHDNGKMNICKYENGSVTPIIVLPGYREIFFDSDYIYYINYQSNGSDFYRVDYNGEHIEYIFTADDNNVQRFNVYNDRIYYEDLGIYDMNSGELIELSSGRSGRINGGYMYYVDEYNLMRMNLEDYSVELVFEDVVDFEFCGDMLIHMNFENIYKIQNGEEKLIFNVSEFFDNEYNYYIDNIQIEGERLFIDISSGPYYSYIVELDINGNFIRKYYENKRV